LHFWVGAFCRNINKKDNSINFPKGVVAISDIITLTLDHGNQIPEKSWMLYLLELFNRQNIAVELNLICSFNNNGKFDAIFNGVNQYQFKNIQPSIGHSYMRQIIINSERKSISYFLEDKTTQQVEEFNLRFSDNANFNFEIANQFTGIEWWNKIGNSLYPIRYQVEISQLMYGIKHKATDPQSLIYLPYTSLIENNEGNASTYPISFYNTKIKDGCICFMISSGSCKNGLRYNC
jgi:hypothetical protein